MRRQKTDVIQVPRDNIVVEGYGLGTLKVLKRKRIVDKQFVNLEDIKLTAKTLSSELGKIVSDPSLPREVREISQVHQLLLEDPFLWKKLEDASVDGKIKIEDYERIRDEIISLLLSTGNPLIQQRVDDIKDLFRNLLLGSSERLDNLRGSVVYSEEFLPSDVMKLSILGVKALLSTQGSHTTHAAILARAFEIPYIIRLPNLSEYEEKRVFVDAVEGKIIINPNETNIHEYERIIEKYTKEKEEIEKYGELKFDDIKIMANISVPQEIEVAKKKGADGIGLFRTEFLFVGRDNPPSEEEQYLVYKKALETFYPEEVVIRLLDIGGDKKIEYLAVDNEENPFLGLRGIRLLLKHKEILKTQLRALLRASAHGNLSVLVPMVTLPEDIEKLLEIIQETKEELLAEGKEIGSFKLGIMVEVPSVIWLIEKIAPYIDFVSIGTNDLTQYIFAADRNNPSVAKYYQDEHEVIFEIIATIAEKAKKFNLPVGVCGELAGKLGATEKLSQLGVTKLSVSPFKVPFIKRKIYEIQTGQERTYKG
ncbi:phosphoenolpyruvate--protein phosphotransferase [Thermococcus aggregans]|uniref:Phosphoenolpyruvate-protein phosphotransferase n=1 Tax=Thermococcus aggregans TaxID=110163 RepID=A0A9E7MX98_THEAG|nr:phosphoenolpyruvate--protein phosphotransferase [Thermococcus aggregans]USS40545.1 phosphoenolpyruvate--protein phosphotransferase [Thermococcus aggregans]